PLHRPAAAQGKFLRAADETARETWDKLSVLNELWEPKASHKPTLFYTPLSELPNTDDVASVTQLEADFRELIGPDNIIVRTSVRSDANKIPNLRRTEGLSPAAAAQWCMEVRDEVAREQGAVDHLAFVAHRFIAARAAAWVRAEPGNPVI